eukprot:356692-Chlamydomonas_euryale.AAC.8
MENQDARRAYNTMWPDLAIIVLCLYTFLANVIMLNLIITLMSDLYAKIKTEQQLVFLRNRADLILEVESTMQVKDMNRFRNIPPYLHLLRPVNLEEKREEERLDEKSVAGVDDDQPAQPLAAHTRHSSAGSQPRRSLLGVENESCTPNWEVSHLHHSTSIMSRVGHGPPVGLASRSVRMSRGGSFGGQSAVADLAGHRAGGGGPPQAAASNMERLLAEMHAALDRQNKEL